MEKADLERLSYNSIYITLMCFVLEMEHRDGCQGLRAGTGAGSGRDTGLGIKGQHKDPCGSGATEYFDCGGTYAPYRVIEL